MLNKIFLLMLVILISRATIIDTYMSSGKKETIKILRLTLESPSFWENKLKDRNVSLGLLNNNKYVILASKENKKLLVYLHQQNKFKLIKTTNALFGKINGDKQKEGDLRTPIGVYDFTSVLSKKDKLEDRYGPLAFTTSYPNLIDKMVYKKTGYGIWLHGKPLDGRKKIDTKGCVALDNDELIKISNVIKYKKSHIIISKNKIANSSLQEISIIMSNLYKWKHSWESNDIKKYLSFYNKRFVRSDGMNLSTFSIFKKRIFRVNQSKEILFKKMEIIPYFDGDNNKHFKITFFESYKSRTFQFKGNKKLFLKIKDNKISILSEK